MWDREACWWPSEADVEAFMDRFGVDLDSDGDSVTISCWPSQEDGTEHPAFSEPLCRGFHVPQDRYDDPLGVWEPWTQEDIEKAAQEMRQTADDILAAYRRTHAARRR